jgi:hypothetical protein
MMQNTDSIAASVALSLNNGGSGGTATLLPVTNIAFTSATAFTVTYQDNSTKSYTYVTDGSGKVTQVTNVTDGVVTNIVPYNG